MFEVREYDPSKVGVQRVTLCESATEARRLEAVAASVGLVAIVLPAGTVDAIHESRSEHHQHRPHYRLRLGAASHRAPA